MIGGAVAMIVTVMRHRGNSMTEDEIRKNLETRPPTVTANWVRDVMSAPAQLQIELDGGGGRHGLFVMADVVKQRICAWVEDLIETSGGSVTIEEGGQLEVWIRGKGVYTVYSDGTIKKKLAEPLEEGVIDADG
jgi:hypothetical protein